MRKRDGSVRFRNEGLSSLERACLTHNVLKIHSARWSSGLKIRAKAVVTKGLGRNRKPILSEFQIRTAH